MIRIGGVGVNSSFLKYVCVRAYTHAHMYICVRTHRCVFTCMYFLALSTERAWLPILCPPVAMNKDAPSSSGHTWHSNPGLYNMTTKRNQSSSEKRLGRGRCKTSLQHLIMSESKQVLRKYMGHVTRTQASAQRGSRLSNQGQFEHQNN